MSNLSTSEQAAKAKQRAKEIGAHLTTDKEFRDRWLGVFIGVLALVMAICSLVGNNTAKDAARVHMEANNTWSFFQAKNLRRQLLRLRIEEVELNLLQGSAMAAPVREAITRKLEEYRALEQLLTSDKERKEGLDELFARGKQLEAERDTLLRKDPYFDGAQTLLQIAIVLASVCLVTGTIWLLYASAALGGVGALLLLNGYFLLVPLPFLG